MHTAYVFVLSGPHKEHNLLPISFPHTSSKFSIVFPSVDFTFTFICGNGNLLSTKFIIISELLTIPIPFPINKSKPTLLTSHSNLFSLLFINILPYALFFSSIPSNFISKNVLFSKLFCDNTLFCF